MDEDEVRVSVAGGVGRMTLNRPKALNALTLGMCQAMTASLLAWRQDPAVELVMLDHAGDRGFCAGGDIRLTANDPAGSVGFFRTEYRLNHLLFAYPKAIVVVMHGVTMGGGAGLALPARIRIATEKTLFAMPETAIGIFPDVGAGWYLPRLPGRTGLWLALTGARLKAEDCMALGLATHFVPEADLEAVKAALLAQPQAAASMLAPYAGEPSDRSTPAVRRDAVDRFFAGDSLETILSALEADGGEWPREQLARLNAMSPFSLKTTLRLMQKGAQAPDFADDMAMELRAMCKMSARSDFREGVRALLVDRDNRPAWSPARLDAVTDEAVEAIFAPLPADEEWTPLPAAD